MPAGERAPTEGEPPQDRPTEPSADRPTDPAGGRAPGDPSPADPETPPRPGEEARAPGDEPGQGETPARPETPADPETPGAGQAPEGDPLVQQGAHDGGMEGGEEENSSESGWPPDPPAKPKPGLNDPNAAEWRYQRYLYKQSLRGKGPGDVLPFDDWKAKHFDAAQAGGRPGRRGGPDQVRTKEYLTQNEGVREVENVELGGHFPDGVRDNDQGGTDYFEVGKMLKKGLPESRESAKLAEELGALGSDDTMTFVDKMDPTNRINYKPGDTTSKTVEDSNREASSAPGQNPQDNNPEY